MAWYNPATWSVVDNVQGQNINPDKIAYSIGTQSYNAGGDPINQTNGGGGWGSTGSPSTVLSATDTRPTNTNISNNGTAVTSNQTSLDNAAISNTQKSIDQLPAILQAALDAERVKYDNANKTFDVQQGQEQAKYDTGTTTNQQNYDSNLMASLRTGAKGLGGLLSILRGTGVEGWANNAVQDTTNSDIRTGLDTRNENQTSLDTGISSFLTDLEGKRRANADTFQNNEFAARGNNATQMQKLYGDMAKYFSDGGNTGEATRYMNMAGDQSPDIARFSTAPVKSYDASPVAVKAANVSAFGAPTEQSITANDGKTASNAGIFTIGESRRRLAGVGA